MTNSPLATQQLNMLALDASSDACSVALLVNIGTDQEQLYSLHEHAPMQQAKRLLPAIQELLESASLTLEQLNAIAYGCGPGSFTGLRLACSVVQAIGFTHHIPSIPISTLAAAPTTSRASSSLPPRVQ